MKHKFELLEFGRGIAALAVVLCHVHWYLVLTPEYVHFVWPWGTWAVQFFFVLSGFIIYFVNGHEIGSGDALTFARRRFIRIFPTYWLIFLGALLLRKLGGNPSYVVDVTPSFLATNIFLLPSHGLFINAAWSLRHELLFYSVFLVCIWNRTVGLAVAAIWLALVLAALAYYGFVDEHQRTLWHTFSSPMNLLFLVGVVSAAAVQRFRLEWILAKGPPLSAWLGRISYPLYLCHLPTFLATHGLLKRIGLADSWIPATIIGIAFSLVVAHVVAICFERPILNRRKAAAGKLTELTLAKA